MRKESACGIPDRFYEGKWLGCGCFDSNNFADFEEVAPQHRSQYGEYSAIRQFMICFFLEVDDECILSNRRRNPPH